jgi:3-oxoacyl-[acyl-carrier protein] reductase
MARCSRKACVDWGVAATTRTILVAGATGYIGVAVCNRLAKGGYSLLLTARDAAKLQALLDDLMVVGPAIHSWISADMSRKSIRLFAEELAKRNIVLDGVVLIPPQPHRPDAQLPSRNTWHKLFQNCFVGPLAMLKAAIATMKPDPANGRIPKIVIIPGISQMLRSAWLEEAKSLAQMLRERSIHINTLSLSGMVTPWYKASPQRRAGTASVRLERRLEQHGDPDEVGIAVETLLSAFFDQMTGLEIQHTGSASAGGKESEPRPLQPH